MIILYILILVLIVLVYTVFILFLLAQVFAIFTTNAPFVPIPRDVVGDIVKNLKLNSNSVLYDLGCGDARVLIKAVEKYPEVKAVGVERAFLPYLLARFYTRKYKNIEIRRENIFRTDVSNATHVFMYLFPGVPDKLIEIFKEKCRPGIRVVSCDFESKNYKPVEIIDIESNNKIGKKLFVYSL